MAVDQPRPSRGIVDGKFFRWGDKKFHVKGVAYGPFAPNADGLHFASLEQTARDFSQIRELGANLVRLYQVPPRWFLDLADQHSLAVLVDIPWNKHLCFDSPERQDQARDAVRRAVIACARHPAVFAFSVANEIPPDIVRWAGPNAVARFIDDLVLVAKTVDPDCLCTYTNFPSTEFLEPKELDFFCFNVYLHDRRPFQDYLARLQMLASDKPLVLGEVGADSLSVGESPKAEMLSWQIEDAFRGGLAGTIVFTFTDDWFRNGQAVDGWQMGLTTRDRQPKPSFAAVGETFRKSPRLDLARAPRVSVVVACYNGERTLKACLDSLQRLNYPDCEIILVDDGSTDATSRIAEKYPAVRRLRHDQNLGLSEARNTGIAAATGEIVAFTDADCRADEDWLAYLVGDLLGSPFVGVGGPNLLPPEDSHIAAAVMASPGGPAHVMLTDRQAEHIPGCNMAFYRWALLELGGFDAVFKKAGDDVDLCWRLQQSGYRIGFSPAGFVWHYRRSTLAAYLRQQYGYGEAEAMLVRKHPENFNLFGNGIWRGRIYGPAKLGVEIQPPVIYHGRFASAGFQKLYASGPATTLMLCTALEYYLLVVFPLGILSTMLPYLIPLAAVCLLVPVALSALAAAQADLPSNRRAWWSRPLIALLFLLQPIVRGWARYRNRLVLPSGSSGLAERESLDSLALLHGPQNLKEARYWSRQRRERLDLVRKLVERLDRMGWPRNTDIGWSEYDVDICVSRWSRLQLTSVAEDHPQNQQLLRWRLKTLWSPAATLLFWAWLGLALLIIGAVAAWRPWSWLMLALSPAMFWYYRSDQRRLRSVVVVFLDELATELGMDKMTEPGVGGSQPGSAPANSTAKANPGPENPQR